MFLASLGFSQQSLRGGHMALGDSDEEHDVQADGTPSLGRDEIHIHRETN